MPPGDRLCHLLAWLCLGCVRGHADGKQDWLVHLQSHRCSANATTRLDQSLSTGALRWRLLGSSWATESPRPAQSLGCQQRRSGTSRPWR